MKILDKLLGNDNLKSMQAEEDKAKALLASIKAKRQQQEKIIITEIKNTYGDKEVDKAFKDIQQEVDTISTRQANERRDLTARHKHEKKVLRDKHKIEKERLEVAIGGLGLKAKATVRKASQDYIKNGVLYYFQSGVTPGFTMPLPKDKATSLHGAIKRHLENAGIASSTANSTAYRINKDYQAGKIPSVA